MGLEVGVITLCESPNTICTTPANNEYIEYRKRGHYVIYTFVR